MSKEVKKLEIYLREIAFDHVVFGCSECFEQVGGGDRFCSGCGVEFKEE